jgi:hypothetical protein
MLCQTCQQAEATIQVSRPVPVGPPDESHYCHACYRMKEAERPPADRPASSSFRFTIRSLMIAAFLFALLNSGLVLYMRGDPIPGTPVRMRDRMLKVLVIANLGLAMYLSELIVMRWFKSLVRHRKTGGTVMTAPRRPDRRVTGRTDVWSDASPPEQIFLFLVHSAFLLFLVVVLCLALDPHLLFLELNFWPLLAVLLAILCVWILLIWGLVDSARRR